MRISRKNRESIAVDTEVSDVTSDKLSKYKTLGNSSSESLVKPVKNNDQVVEMDESEYIKKFNIKTETFKEQACRVLNILNKQGVDIYSEDNTPGMYLRKKGENITPAGISQLFRKKRKTPEDTDDVSSELKNFFKSKK